MVVGKLLDDDVLAAELRGRRRGAGRGGRSEGQADGNVADRGGQVEWQRGADGGVGGGEAGNGG